MADRFIWTELSAVDPAAAERFYGAVVGWTTEAHDASPDYRLLMADGRAAGGLMRLPEMARARGPWWAGYIGVDDTDAAANDVAGDGGKVHVPPQDIPQVGRFAVVSDPQGAVFMLMTPLPRQDDAPPAEPMAPGTVVWRELQTSDWQAAWEFYARHFGWKKEDAMDMGAMGTYQIFTIAEGEGGGMMNGRLPRPMWVHYFHVTDIDAAEAAIRQGGGEIVQEPIEIPGGGFSLVARDPQGAIFGLAGARRA